VVTSPAAVEIRMFTKKSASVESTLAQNRDPGGTCRHMSKPSAQLISLSFGLMEGPAAEFMTFGL
jgi:hypothetical protein